MPNVALREREEVDLVSLLNGVISIELSRPITVLVQGLNSHTGERKNYLLKVTQFGKLQLV